MASIINEIIPIPPFQIIQNRLGEILFEELTNQHILQDLDSNFEFFVERIAPYGISEDVVISLAYREGDNSEYTQSNSQVQNMFFIDIFAGGVESQFESMDENVRLKLFKYVGMIKYILNSGKYPTLGLPLGIIGNRHVKKITFDTDYSNWGNHSNYDGSGVRFCRMIYLVTAVEDTETWQGIPLVGNDTIISVDNGNGTQLKFNN